MNDVWWLRIGIVVAGVVLMATIWYIGTRPRSGGQGKRVTDERGGRTEPTLGQQAVDALGHDGEAVQQAELDLIDRTAGTAAAQSAADLGKRIEDDFDKIVTLYVAARAGNMLHGPDIVVAAEKVGLTFGHMDVFHRLVEGHPERGPVFSVANIQNQGSFRMSEIQSLETPAIAFFLTLPAPMPALDSWEMMQPAAQRMAELLDGVLLDEQRNALGRQRIAHIREDMRQYDREREAGTGKTSRW